MAENLDSFDESELGAFTESPLGARIGSGPDLANCQSKKNTARVYSLTADDFSFSGDQITDFNHVADAVEIDALNGDIDLVNPFPLSSTSCGWDSDFIPAVNHAGHLHWRFEIKSTVVIARLLADIQRPLLSTSTRELEIVSYVLPIDDFDPLDENILFLHERIVVTDDLPGFFPEPYFGPYFGGILTVPDTVTIDVSPAS